MAFDSLSGLVDYYHNKALKTAGFQQILTSAVPPVKIIVLWDFAAVTNCLLCTQRCLFG